MQILFFGEFANCEIDSIINLKTILLLKKKPESILIKLCSCIETNLFNQPN